MLPGMKLRTENSDYIRIGRGGKHSSATEPGRKREPDERNSDYPQIRPAMHVIRVRKKTACITAQEPRTQDLAKVRFWSLRISRTDKSAVKTAEYDGAGKCPII